MTAQAHEKIWLDGNEESMAFCPPLPTDHPHIRELSPKETELKQKAVPPIVFSTACWRGYIGTWEITDGKFFLKELMGRFEKTTDEPVLADWFTGVLRIPQGEVLEYVHMGFGSVHEKELHIKVERGQVKARQEIDNRDKKVCPDELAIRNLPGSENRFDGDDL